MQINFPPYTIAISDDPTYGIHGSGQPGKYTYEYSDGELIRKRAFAINKRGITIKKGDQTIASAILCENGGRSTISEAIFHLEHDFLYVCIGDKLYALSFPSLKVNWFYPVDFGTIHSVNSFAGDLLIHANSGLVRISKSGSIQWRFQGGNGVFTPGDNRLSLTEGQITVIDGNDRKFVLDGNGEEIV
ncbi:MAG: hypothetical protein AAFV80_17080 [Bacteroidota bacterium]